MPRRNHRTLAIAAAAGYLVAAGTPTLAQPEPTPPAPPAPLAGPDADDNTPPYSFRTFSEAPRFGAGNMQQRMARAQALSAAAFRDAVAQLREQSNADLDLSEEQRDTINLLLTDFVEQQRAYREEHRDEIRELMATLRPESGEAPQRRGPQPNRDAGLSPEQQDARERLREIRQNAPSAEGLQERVWIVLTDDQRAFVEAEIERRMEQRRDRAQRGPRGPRGQQDRERTRQREQQRGDRAPQPTNAERFAERLDALESRLERLTPEQQQRVMAMIDRLIERIDTQLEAQAERAAPPDMRERRFFPRR